jgi:hypothetical protein
VALFAVVLHPSKIKGCSGSRTPEGGRYAALLLLQCMLYAGLHCPHGMYMECGCCAIHCGTTAFCMVCTLSSERSYHGVVAS